MWISDNLPFALISFVAAVVCAGVAVYAWRRRRGPGILLFSLLMAALTWAAVMSGFEYLLSAQALRVKVFASQLYLVGSGAAALLALLFALHYTHRDRWLVRPVLWLLWLLVIVEWVLIFTNDRHGLYWPSITTTSLDPGARVVFSHGPVTNFFAFVSYALMFSAAAILVVSALRAPAIYRRQSTLFVLAVLAPVLVNLVYYLDLGPWQDFDFTPVAFALSGSLLALAIFRYQAVDLTPVALDTLFATLSDGVLVVNERGLVVSSNPAARAMLALTENRLLGRSISLLPPPWAAALGEVCSSDNRSQEVTLTHLRPTRSVEVTSSTLLDRNLHVVGSTIVLHDVTGYRTLQQNLAQVNADLEQRVAARTAELSTMRDALAQHVANLSSQLSVLYEVILLGGQSLDIDAVRDQALETVMAALHAPAGVIMLWDGATGASQLAVVKGIRDEDAARLRTLPVDWLFGESVPHTILDLEQPDVPLALRIPQMCSCLTSSVQRRGVPLAAICIFWPQQPALSVEAIALFRGLVDQLAILAENARLRQLQNESLVQEERSRLARDLHDSVTQTLYALALNAETTANAFKNGRSEQLEQRLGRIAAAARQALREMRLLLYELRQGGPQRPPLAEALRLRLEAVESRAGIIVELDVDPNLLLPAACEQDLYWVAMEALNNALKHASAGRVLVALTQRADMVELLVGDDGRGLVADQASGGGLGLRSMSERAARLGGHLALGRSPLGGVEVRLTAPLPAGRPVHRQHEDVVAPQWEKMG